LLTAAGRTDCLALTSGAAAMCTRLREHHVAARRFDRAGAVAVVAPALSRSKPAGAVTRPAVLLTHHRDLAMPAANRVLERQCDLLMEIDPANRLVALARLTLEQHVGEQIAEGRRGGTRHRRREIE